MYGPIFVLELELDSPDKIQAAFLYLLVQGPFLQLFKIRQLVLLVISI